MTGAKLLHTNPQTVGWARFIRLSSPMHSRVGCGRALQAPVRQPKSSSAALALSFITGARLMASLGARLYLDPISG